MVQQMTLSDGRKLDYAVSGAKDGLPFLWIHGTPSSYLPFPGFPEACEKHGLALITFSRPGYGNSTRHKDRRIIDGIADFEELLKHLGHEKCVVGGWSGGGPYSMACAARLRGCVAALSIAGVAPYDAEGLDFLEGQGQDSKWIWDSVHRHDSTQLTKVPDIDETNIALEGEEAMQAYCKPQRTDMLQSDVAGLTEVMATLLPDVDKRAMLENHDIGQYFVDDTKEALKNSPDGWVDDNLAFVHPWGFDVNEIRVPLFLYQGSADKMVPYGHGKWLAGRIPSPYIKAHLLEGEGHISIALGRIDGMLKELLSAAS